jgi:hypothetical protein
MTDHSLMTFAQSALVIATVAIGGFVWRMAEVAADRALSALARWRGRRIVARVLKRATPDERAAMLDIAEQAGMK